MSENPSITLAGKQYSVPPLVPRQLRIILPAMMRVGKSGSLKDITEENLSDIYAIVFWGAVWPNDKKATLEGFLDSPASMSEINAALPVIRQQTGMFTTAPEGATPGEFNPASAD